MVSIMSVLGGRVPGRSGADHAYEDECALSAWLIGFVQRGEDTGDISDQSQEICNPWEDSMIKGQKLLQGDGESVFCPMGEHSAPSHTRSVGVRGPTINARVTGSSTLNPHMSHKSQSSSPVIEFREKNASSREIIGDCLIAVAMMYFADFQETPRNSSSSLKMAPTDAPGSLNVITSRNLWIEHGDMIPRQPEKSSGCGCTKIVTVSLTWTWTSH